MAHELAGAFEQVIGIGELGTPEQPDGHVRGEGIHVSKCRVTDACGRLVVVNQLTNIVSARAHHLEPAARDRAQIARLLAHPDVGS